VYSPLEMGLGPTYANHGIVNRTVLRPLIDEAPWTAGVIDDVRELSWGEI
jgi:hypothetical protein